MNVRELLQTLKGLSTFSRAAGSKRAAEGFDTVQELFIANDERPVQEAIQELKGLLEQERQQARDAHIARLLEARTDQASFEKAFAVLETDKSIAKEDIDAIGYAYTNGRSTWPSRRSALTAIRKKFVERAYQESKMRIVEKYKAG